MPGAIQTCAIYLVLNSAICALGLCIDYLLQAVISLCASKVCASMDWGVEMLLQGNERICRVLTFE